MIAANTIQRVPEQDGVLDLANLSEVGAFMSRVFTPGENTRSPVGHPDKKRSHEQTPVPEEDKVDDLLSKASKAIEFLAARCTILEQELADKDELSAEHEKASKQWQHFAVKMQVQAASDQNTIADLTAQLNAVQARVASLEAAEAEARQSFATANAKSTKLQNQVVAAFGRRSPVHSVLQAIMLQEAAE